MTFVLRGPRKLCPFSQAAIQAHQRSKLERYGETLFAVLRAARYLDGPEAILYAIMDLVVDDYVPVMAGLENDIDEIEPQVFSGNAGVSRRTYQLSREPSLLPLFRSGWDALDRRPHSGGQPIASIECWRRPT